MKKFIIVLVLVSLTIFVIYSTRVKALKVSTVSTTQSEVKSKPKENKTIKQSTAIFIPYWNIDGKMTDLSIYDRLIYFGITVDKTGVAKNEAGYANVKKFVDLDFFQNKYLTLRMTDSDTNKNILENPTIQGKIINDTLALVRQNKLQGVVLDLEINDILNNNTTSQIDVFVQKFYSQAKNYYIPFSLAIYGDSFYRKRPYDIDFLAKNSDEIMLMAYDLHKSGGEPGPNFPLSGQAVYGYDLQNMISDFKHFVPPEKLTVVFGMYGYDWSVDEKKRPIKPAKALTLLEINDNFINQCKWQDCVVKRDDVSRETEVDYVYSEIKNNLGYLDYHIIWFEDKKSVEDKTQYLLKEGIGNVAYWVYGYF